MRHLIILFNISQIKYDLLNMICWAKAQPTPY
jgi:hypothetical protein